jgi:hypothetical protein
VGDTCQEHSKRGHLLPSPLRWLCFSLKATRSASVKPSWAVMKLMLCCGPRPPRHCRPPLFPHQSPVLPHHQLPIANLYNPS